MKDGFIAKHFSKGDVLWLEKQSIQASKISHSGAEGTITVLFSSVPVIL